MPRRNYLIEVLFGDEQILIHLILKFSNNLDNILRINFDETLLEIKRSLIPEIKDILQEWGG